MMTFTITHLLHINYCTCNVCIPLRLTYNSEITVPSIYRKDSCITRLLQKDFSMKGKDSNTEGKIWIYDIELVDTKNFLLTYERSFEMCKRKTIYNDWEGRGMSNDLLRQYATDILVNGDINIVSYYNRFCSTLFDEFLQENKIRAFNLCSTAFKEDCSDDKYIANHIYLLVPYIKENVKPS